MDDVAERNQRYYQEVMDIAGVTAPETLVSIEDKTTERNNDRQDLAAGIMNPWEYRMKWYNEDEATAKKMLPKMEDMTTEGENEIE